MGEYAKQKLQTAGFRRLRSDKKADARHIVVWDGGERWDFYKRINVLTIYAGT